MGIEIKIGIGIRIGFRMDGNWKWNNKISSYVWFGVMVGIGMVHSSFHCWIGKKEILVACKTI